MSDSQSGGRALNKREVVNGCVSRRSSGTRAPDGLLPEGALLFYFLLRLVTFMAVFGNKKNYPAYIEASADLIDIS